MNQSKGRLILMPDEAMCVYMQLHPAWLLQMILKGYSSCIPQQRAPLTMNVEDDATQIQSCSREHQHENHSSHGDIPSANSMDSVPRRYESSTDRLTSFGNIHFDEEVKSKGLSSIKKSIEGNLLFRHLWNDVLVMLCVVATLLDPLFCYILIVDKERNCIEFDNKLKITVVVLRSLVDFSYILLILFHFRIGYTAPDDANRGGLCTLARRYLLSYFAMDILAVLPLPQVVVLIVIQGTKGAHLTIAIRAMKFILIFQYLPRVSRVYSFLKKARWSSGILPDSAGAKAIFNLFLYMLASHVFGSFWYLFSVERKASCLQGRCHSPSYCPQINGNSSIERSCVNDVCSRKAPPNDTTAFNYGIFDDAFNSGVVFSTHFIWKFSYCCWWGLQNLSSLGQGLKTSKHLWEIYFAASITITGLVLFALLIGNLQTFLQATVARLEEMRLKGQDIELWMAYHSLPRDLRNRIKQYEKYKWRKTRGVDVANILHNLPRDLRRDTTRHLCLRAFNSVSMFQNTDEKFLDAVCVCLKPMLYIERNFIVREGEPLDEMIFIIHGKLWIYSNSNRSGESSSSSESLTKGNFFGEDLLRWVLRDPLLSTVPISTKTVSTHTKVEAFVLSANDLKNVVSKFWWLFSREVRNDPDLKERWEPWAALVLQAAWRRYFKSKREKEKSELSIVVESGSNSQPSATSTAIHVSRFLARALHVINRRRRSNDKAGPSNSNDLQEHSNV